MKEFPGMARILIGRNWYFSALSGIHGFPSCSDVMNCHENGLIAPALMEALQGIKEKS